MKRLLEIVNDRNAIVDGLEEDRRRSDDLNHTFLCVRLLIVYDTSLKKKKLGVGLNKEII